MWIWGSRCCWATENVGANAPEQYGKYYAWGEIEPKEEYTADNSAYYRRPQADFAGDSALDVATAAWGEPWRMPTMADFAELLDKCTFIWIHDSERTGYKVIGRNGNSIFFPAAGYVNRQSLNNVGEREYYWTSSPYGRETEYAYYFRFDDAFFYVDRDDRLHGRVVRPVTD